MQKVTSEIGVKKPTMPKHCKRHNTFYCHQCSYARGLEDAAKIADYFSSVSGVAKTIAAKIRALREKKP